MDIAAIKVDLEKEIEGIWHNVDGETSLKIARWGNKNFQEYLNQLNAKARAEKYFNDEVRTENIAIAMAKHIITDWKGLKEYGKEIKYSSDTAKKLLLNEEMKDFKRDVFTLSNMDEMYRKEGIAEVAKKSLTLSSGDSNGDQS